MSKTKTKKLTLTEWCDQQVKDGHELKLVWDGGGDSGWCHFEIDGGDVENEYTNHLVNHMYDELDYGSWAGEFTAQGDAIYNPETKCFEGTDYYSEESTESVEANIEVRIPKSLWFSQLSIRFECDHGEDDVKAECSFLISNGFFTPEHTEAEVALSIDLKDRVDEEVDKYMKQGVDFSGMWQNIVLTPADFTSLEDSDLQIATIKDLDFRYQDSEDNKIYLNVKEIEEDDED